MTEMSIYAARMELAGQMFIKIGVASKPHNRLVFLNTSAPSKVSFAAISRPMPRSDAYEIEALIHRALNQFHSNGEWFRACPRVLAAIDLVREKGQEQMRAVANNWVAQAFIREDPTLHHY